MLIDDFPDNSPHTDGAGILSQHRIKFNRLFRWARPHHKVTSRELLDRAYQAYKKDPKSSQYQPAILKPISQSPVPGSTLADNHDATNTDPTASPQDDHRFNTSPPIIGEGLPTYYPGYPMPHFPPPRRPNPIHSPLPRSSLPRSSQDPTNLPPQRLNPRDQPRIHLLRSSQDPTNLPPQQQNPRDQLRIPRPHLTPPSSPLATTNLPSKPEAVGAHGAPVREPPAWRLNYKIGTGACGTVFLENVHISGMKSPELWAVKRIPRHLPNFTFKRYQAEIKNLQRLARVSFAWTSIV